MAVTLLESAMLKLPLPFATPLPNWPTPHVPKKIRTVLLAGAVPVTVGVRLVAGEAGLVDAKTGAADGAAVVKLHEVAVNAFPATS